MKAIVLVVFVVQMLYAFENALIDEESPYLLQHAHNPVDWMPYSKEAFTKAKKEHKLIFLSIGYSTCHWCHVMESESFEDTKIAALLNDNYISIKVDREEMPYIDTFYQQMFLHVKKRSGGWPMNVILDENADAFFIATYIPPTKMYGVQGLKSLLPSLAKTYKTAPLKIEKKVKAFKKMNRDTLLHVKESVSKKSIFDALLKQYDDLYYGFRSAPKFPEAAKVDLLFSLDSLHVKEAKSMALSMLDAMALRGMYDQSEGGFFRYSTDAAYEIPHFEKMLYNQAELIPLYVEAYKRTDKALYKKVVQETIGMLYQRFEYKNLFYSASDADTHDHEGAYFTYTKKELDEALKDSLHVKQITKAFGLDDGENFDGRFHLNIYSDKRPKGFEAFQKNLKKLRATRAYPFIDKKMVVSYNAMLIKALFIASTVDESYKNLALKSLDRLLKVCYKNAQLYHQVMPNTSAYKKGLLEDYSAVIALLISAYDVTHDARMLKKAELFLQRAIEKFYSNNRWYLNEEQPLVKADLRDKYYSSALGIMLQNLLTLAALEEKMQYQFIAQQTLKTLHTTVDTPATNKAHLMDMYGVVVLKNSAQALLNHAKEIERINYPFLHLKSDASLNQFLACKVGTCFAYSKDLLHIKKLIINKTMH